MAFLYKLLEDGKSIAMSDKGFPIVIDDEQDDKEIPLDAIHLYGKVPELQNQLKQEKTKVTDLSAITKHLEGIDNVPEFLTKANTAIDLTANIDASKLIDAGKVEEIKIQAQENLQIKMDALSTKMDTEIDTRDKQIVDRDNTIFDLMVADRFNTSPFVKDSLAITSNMARKYFGDSFKIEVNTESEKREVVGYYKDGTQIYSAERPGELADFDEALQLLVDKDPEKDNFLSGSGGSGTGAEGSKGGKVDKNIADLKAQYQKARDDKNSTAAIRIKNRLFELGVTV